jgi:hypothetical protein
MDKTALVKADLEVGRKIVRELEFLGIPVDLAAWLQDDRSDWQLVISSPALTMLGGTRRVYDAILTVLANLDEADLELGDVTAWSPSDTVVKNLKNLVRTGDELQAVSLHDLDLGPKWFRSAVVYRSQGGRSPGRWLEMDAHVRAKATGKLGIVWSREDTPNGARYLVRHFLAPKDRLPKNGEFPPPDEQIYDADELEFLYAIRPGGWPEKPPLMARPAQQAARTS